jgi:hypothetical protein
VVDRVFEVVYAVAKRPTREGWMKYISPRHGDTENLDVSEDLMKKGLYFHVTDSYSEAIVFLDWEQVRELGLELIYMARGKG